MAQECTIPTDAADLRMALQLRYFGEGLYRRVPVILPALVIAVGAWALALWASWIVSIVVCGWGLAAVGITVIQSWLGAMGPGTETMPDEVRRLVAANVDRVHPSRVAALQARAAHLTLTDPNFGTDTSQVLQDLREATGEAWRCPKKRRLPIPLSL